MLRTTSTRLHKARLLATLLLALIAAPGSFAAPEGEEIINGDVTFHRDGSVTLIRAGDGAIIEYDSFDIFADEVVEFVQPGADARVLNRVFGEQTRIEGSLLANGIVYIVNPAGIFIDGEAVVDVGGLIAAAGHISNEDFLAGVDHFDLTGPVVNASDSVEGHSVSLLGTSVANLGEISAPDGTIALVAGDRVVLTRLGGRIYVEVDGPPEEMPGGAGVIQAGRVDAGGGQVVFAVGDHYSLAINHEGVTRGHDVLLRGGDDGLLVVRGEIDASSDGVGGRVDVTGDKVALLGARLDASGGSGGGAIRIGGARRGEGPLPNARRTFVDSQSELVADAITAGDGGSVIVWGDEAAVMNGSVSARGGAASGDGGFTEISSPGVLSWDGDVDLGAEAGLAGTLLFDPQDIVIVGGTSDGSDDPNGSPTELRADDDTLGVILFGDVGDGSEPFQIFESEIEGTNANVKLEATNSVTISGTFDNEVAGEGSDVVVVGGALTIRTRNDTGDEVGSAETPGIDLGAIAWETDGGDITIETGADAVAFDTVADATVGDLTAAGGRIGVSTRNGAISVGNVDTSGADGASGVDAGDIALVARGEGTSSIVTGDLIAIGGAGATGAGGDGGKTSVLAEDGSIALGAIDTSGGDGSGFGSRGRAGEIEILAGFGEDGAGSITLSGPITATDGSGFGSVRADTTLTLDAADAVEFDPGVAGPHITTTEVVRLAGSSVGATTQIEIDAVETTGFPSGPFSGRRTLTVEASETADVAVTSAASFNQLSAVVTGADADIDIVQTGSSIDIDGAPGVSTIAAVDSVDDSVAGGVSVQVTLQDSLEEGLDESLDLVVSTGAIVAGGALRLRSEDDIALAAGAIVANPLPGGDPDDPVDTAIVEIRADIDLDGDGAISASSPGTHIQTRGDVSLFGVSVGAAGPIEIDAQITPQAAPPADDPFSGRNLFVQVSEAADVLVSNGAFQGIVVGATSTEADFDIVQVGSGTAPDPGVTIDIDGAPGVLTVAEVDAVDASVDGGVAIQIDLLDALTDVDDVNLELAIADDAVGTSGALVILSEDDVTLGESAVTMEPLPGDAGTRQLTINADSDDDGAGGIEASGSGGPQILTEGDVTLVAVSAGSGGAIEIDAGSIPDAREDGEFAVRTLRMEVTEGANVAVTNGAFDGFSVVARSSEADFDVLQIGGGTPVDPGFVLDIDGAPGTSTLVELDSGDPAVLDGIAVQLEMIDDLEGVDDVDYELSVASGAVTAGGPILIFAEDDVVVADGAIAMTAVDPANPTETASLLIVADSGNGPVPADGTGAITGSGTAIDMNADGSDEAGRLDLFAANGIGTPSGALGIGNAGAVTATTMEDGGIHLESTEGDTFALEFATIEDGDGDVVVTSTDGTLRIGGPITTSGDDMGDGGAVTIGVTQPDDQIQLAGGGLVIDANGPVTFDGAVALLAPASVLSEDDVTFAGTIDGNPDPNRVQRILTIDAEGMTRFGGDVGSTQSIRGLAIDGDVELAQDTSFSVEDLALFGGNLDASADDVAAATITAGELVVFGGDVGTGGRLSGLAIDSDQVLFGGDDAQQVVTGDGGISLDANGLASPPPDASLAKVDGDLMTQDGDLSLMSTGAILVGPNHKLTVEGRLDLEGASVEIGDANALEIQVVSDDFRIRARETAPLLLASGGTAPDRGTDLFANEMETSSAPVIIGTGPTPRIATLSGSVDGAGAGSVPVAMLMAPIQTTDLQLGQQVLDLGFTISDPGHEEPLRGEAVEPLLAAIPSDEPGAGSATPPVAQQVLAFLRCADAKPGPGASGCAAARGSALDSTRGDEVADRYRRLLGSSAEGQAARRILEGDPRSQEARAVLRDLATLLIQLRLLGMDDASYEGLRSELIGAAHAGGAGASEAALLDAIREQGRGVAL